MSVQAYDDNNRRYFSTELLKWYQREQRDLPWRGSGDPYHIWVSEIMLQQTRVDTVIPYFNRFIERFPTLRHLAEAPEEDVLKHWEGLGYYSRARNLQSAVREVVAEYGAKVPDQKKQISSLKGVGPYTAGAILSIAYNQAEPAVDGNVMRVLSRYFLIEDDIARPATRVSMESLGQSLIPEGEAASFNQALMELGALVCTPKSPSCNTCPVGQHCAAKWESRERELPIKSKAKQPKRVYRLAALIEGTGEHEGQVLVRQRPNTGLLAKMWELPHVEVANEEVWDSLAEGGQWLESELNDQGVAIQVTRHMNEAQHIFTHLIWQVKVVGAVATNEHQLENLEGYAWVGPDQFENFVWPNIFRKLLTDYFKTANP
ncbi:MAG: A/G-specific adenine glycosylase [Candidatus Cohnella colombiensis]|uniref:Adenine DNA glycosylase n=1 Tax=Candidatus Cohnella colombiensis TaxID=3121368 RepID=A0AA95F2P6_9BACL|nr:MAG: A/G-specific adenine glycosylase [Cohnella sp.]